ncbi:MAG: hypothetical protein M1819_003493 [Sarea resinae]|nr:MAG: hypothetical protein M1819_003493 [Sarea resinae]
MGKAPAVVIVVRHGARLDAADKQWHLTSPTPYDPPLTYGGWVQSRALGARIASLLYARETALELEKSTDGSRPRSSSDAKTFGGEAEVFQNGDHKRGRAKRRKHRVIIHTSPFLRCIQTSIAISAGMAQYQGQSHLFRHASTGHRPSKPTKMFSGSPRLQAVDPSKSPGLPAIPEPEEDLARHVQKRNFNRPAHGKPILRVDAFLGEWLSPDYFDLITPPPNSSLMVAGAKADLLQSRDHIDASISNARSNSTVGHFPGGWGGGRASVAVPDETNGSLSSMASLSQALPRRERASSQSSPGGARALGEISPNSKKQPGGYTPPTPAYAISPSEPIPRGYVGHARDACLEVDYQWDSLREPLNWGSGGEYGEEWSAMHKRFRKGLENMIRWYENHDAVEKEDSADGLGSHSHDSDEDTEYDDVLVLVTHGAGCNALIGALTNQPVLLDVGMASLTMAVRKKAPGEPASPRTERRSASAKARRESVDTCMPETYDVKLVASTEHLRPESNPLNMPQLQAANVPPSVTGFRNRYGAHASAGSPIDSNYFLGERDTRTRTASAGIRQSSNSRSPLRSSFASKPGSGAGSGLWSHPSSVVAPEEHDEVLEDDLVSNLDDSSDDKRDDESDRNGKERSGSDASSGIQRADSPRGLWGAPPAPLRTPNERERGPKRRWTVDQGQS